MELLGKILEDPRIKDWPSAQATVREVPSTFWRKIYFIDYVVGEKTYHVQQVFSSMKEKDLSLPIQIHYNPKNPAISILADQTERERPFFYLVAAFFFVACLLMLYTLFFQK